ncbi:DUF4139 domain-containing protein [Planococcus koreensis]|uniref:DUF4139 domain-containing protein n=1 Tax=Planococcus koreensis TaxID=112331 RepID=UPI0039FBEB38
MKIQSTQEERKSLRLTVYNGGFGLVKEVRLLESSGPVSEIQFMDIAEHIEADSVMVRGLQVLEQNYDYDLADGQKLLGKYIGQVVTVRNQEAGEEMAMRLLSTSDGIVGERTYNGEILINPPGGLVLPALPDGLFLRPSLIFQIAPMPLQQEVQVSYMTKGIEWEASYVAEIAGKTVSLSGWIKLRNETGTSFPDAALKFISGEVNRYETPHLFRASGFMQQKNMGADLPIEEHGFADYHAYTLERPVTLLNGQLKQINFMRMEGASYKKAYVVERNSRQAAVKLQFKNSSANGLGIPLPKGLMKVFEQDVDGELEFAGEDFLEHTPNGETVSLKIGQAADILSESREALRERRGKLEVVTCIYEVKNKKQEGVKIDIDHEIFEPLWKMESSSHDYEVKSSRIVEFRVWVGAEKSVAVEFTYVVDKGGEENPGPL